MAVISFAEGSALFDSTPIENMFLLEYLPMAPEGMLRVYLYARMLALHPEMGSELGEIAQALRMDEDAVYAAFAWWEQRGLVRRVSDRPPAYELLPVRSEEQVVADPMERDYYQYRDFNAALQGLFKTRAVDHHEYRLANDWLNVLGYDQEAVLRLVEYGIRSSRSKDPTPGSVFKRMDKLAAQWADRGCRTAEDVEKAIAEVEGVYQVAQAVLKRLSVSRKPTVPELECVKRWVDEWRFTEEQILEACEETVKTSRPSFGYLDSILKSRASEEGALWKPLSEVLKELDPQAAQPTPDQLATYKGFLDMGFEAETVRLAAVQCKRKRKTRLEDVAWMLGKWAEKRLFSPADAQAYLDRMQAEVARVRRLLERCGLERRPAMDDMTLYEGWRRVHGEDVIDFAADCAKGMQVPMKYVDRLLADWAEQGVKTVEEARARREVARAEKAATGGSARAPAANPALDYQQRTYTEADFGDDFYVDLEKLGEKEN